MSPSFILARFQVEQWDIRARALIIFSIYIIVVPTAIVGIRCDVVCRGTCVRFRSIIAVIGV